MVCIVYGKLYSFCPRHFVLVVLDGQLPKLCTVCHLRFPSLLIRTHHMIRASSSELCRDRESTAPTAVALKATCGLGAAQNPCQPLLTLEAHGLRHTQIPRLAMPHPDMQYQHSSLGTVPPFGQADKRSIQSPPLLPADSDFPDCRETLTSPTPKHSHALQFHSKRPGPVQSRCLKPFAHTHSNLI